MPPVGLAQDDGAGLWPAMVLEDILRISGGHQDLETWAQQARPPHEFYAAHSSGKHHVREQEIEKSVLFEDRERVGTSWHRRNRIAEARQLRRRILKNQRLILYE